MTDITHRHFRIVGDDADEGGHFVVECDGEGREHELAAIGGEFVGATPPDARSTCQWSFPATTTIDQIAYALRLRK